MAKAKKPTKAKKESAPKVREEPVIDPAHAAAAAASMVAHNISMPATTDDETRSETATFRNFKQSLSKPASQTIGGLLDKHAPAGQKRSSQPFSGGKQVGHNQTFGADVSRKNVPRRTGG